MLRLHVILFGAFNGVSWGVGKLNRLCTSACRPLGPVSTDSDCVSCGRPYLQALRRRFLVCKASEVTAKSAHLAKCRVLGVRGSLADHDLPARLDLSIGW